jgi:hypothetical protein
MKLSEKLKEKLKEKLGDTEPIKGFKVMEWLRAVRDANYELSIQDPEAYRRKREVARRRIELLNKRYEARKREKVLIKKRRARTL